jgi:hypothetical protein
MKPCLFRAFCLGLLLTGAWPRAWAQSTAANVSGTVHDQQQQALPGATVTLRNVDTGQVRTTVSDQTGNFRLLGLQPGLYDMTIELSGFATHSRPGVQLAISQEAELNATMRIASLAEAITVSAELPLAEPPSTTLGRTITTKQIEALPVLARDFTNLAILTPGVLTNHSTPRGATGIVTAGQTGRNNTFLIDGVSHDEVTLGNSRGSVSLEAVKEFAVLTNNFSAEYGHASGAIVSVLTRSGTNTYAGRAFYFHRDDRWDATHAAARLTAPPTEKTTLEQKVFGGFFGGPISRDKAFFFSSVEETRLDTEQIVTSGVLSTFRPNDSQRLPVRGRNPQLLFRTDLIVRNQHTLTTRYRLDRATRTNAFTEPRSVGETSPAGLIAGERRHDVTTQDQDAAVLANQVLGTSGLNEIRVQFARRYVNQDVAKYCPSCPAENRPSILLGKSPLTPQRRTEDRWQFVDAFTYLLPDRLGDHSLKFGLDTSFLGVDSLAPLQFDGIFTFTHDRPFDAEDPSTYPSRYQVQRGDPFIHLADRSYAAFFQDQWRIQPNLTLNLGARWDYEDALGVTGDRDNIAPRLSVAFDPWNTGRTILRGGYGMYYDQLLFTVPIDAQRAQTFVTTVIPDPGYPDPLDPNPRRAGGSPRPSITRVADLVTPYTNQASVGMRHQRGQLVVSVDGVWARGHNLLRTRDLNYPDLNDPLRRRPDPSIQEIRVRETAGRSWYRALQIGIQKQPLDRHSYAIAYTWSRSERDTEDFDFRAQDQRDYAAERGPSFSDARHRLSASLHVELPARVNVTMLLTARSMLPYNITTGLDDNRDMNFNDRPSGVGRNAARGDDFWEANARLARNFRIGRQQLELLLEVFNLTNHRNWMAYDGNQRSATFGKPTDATNAREVQMGIRVSF